MALTRNFKETIMERVEADPEYADALFEQGVQAILDGDVDVGKSIVRDYINATIGFDALADEDISIEGLLVGKGDQQHL